VEEEIRLYYLSLAAVPQYVYEGLLSILCLGIVVLLVFKGKDGFIGISKLVLIEYVFLIYCLIVLIRPIIDAECNFIPFGNYGDPDLFLDRIMNVVMFIPIGFLLGLGHKRSIWWKTLLIGMSFSVIIEISQLVLKRGCCDVDDVIHNTLGCMIGYGIYALGKAALLRPPITGARAQ